MAEQDTGKVGVLMFELAKNQIYGFMHVATMGNWEEVVTEQLNLIESSGLRAKTNKLFVGLLGENKTELFQGKTTAIFYNSNLKLAENFTLLQLHKCASYTPDSKFWYIHTKGVSHFGKPLHENVSLWRKYLEYFTIEKHEDCIKYLDEGYDACGPEWGLQCCNISVGFAGNFWWANTNYLKTVVAKHLMIHNRFAAECNFVANNNPKIKSLHNANIPFYYEPYPPEKYRS